MFVLQVVNEALSVGASLLLPPLPERMDVLHSLLPQAPDSWDNLTRGEVSRIMTHCSKNDTIVAKKRIIII